MGRAKRDHIAALLALPRVSARWRDQHGASPNDADVDRLYNDFLPLQREVLADHADVIPGVPEVVAECRRRGLRIGGSTGYTRALMDILEPIIPRSRVCPRRVDRGRLCGGWASRAVDALPRRRATGRLPDEPGGRR